ncbi:hypothetical protein V1511DRAFT_457866 [Dipodascopsis uninucleata]
MLNFPRNEIQTELYREMHSALSCVKRKSYSEESLGNVFNVYLKLPHPRPLHMSRFHLEMMVKSYLAAEKSIFGLQFQYLTLIDEILECDMPISSAEFAAYLSYVSTARSTNRAEDRLYITLKLFRDLEDSGLKATDASVFNVLLIAAIRCHKLDVVSQILSEMKARGIDPDRFTFVNLIYFHGKLHNRDMVRQMVESAMKSNQVIDNVIIESIISAFVRCRDIHSAEQLLDFVEKQGIEHGWDLKRLKLMERRILASNFKQITENMQNDQSAEVKEVAVTVGPLETSYDPLLSYYAAKGDFDELVNLIDRLDRNNLSRRRAYNLLFKAFCIHGNRTNMNWTSERLETVYSTFVEYCETENILDRALSVWIVRAFAIVTLDLKRVVEVWDQLISIYTKDGTELKGISSKFEDTLLWSKSYVTTRTRFKPNYRRKTPQFSVIN